MQLNTVVKPFINVFACIRIMIRYVHIVGIRELSSNRAQCFAFSSVLCHCWLGHRKDVQYRVALIPKYSLPEY